MDKPLIRPSEFISRLNKYVLIPYSLDYLSRNGNLKENILKFKMAGFKYTLDLSSDIWKDGVSEEEKVKEAEKMEERIKKTYKDEVDNYFPILFNQALVMSCTIFDLFLEESLEAIVTKEKRVLKALANEEDISIDDVIGSDKYDDVFSAIKDKVLDRFGFLGIAKKLGKIRKIGIDLEKVFEFEFFKEEVKSKYPDGIKHLMEIYKTRNNIVHKDTLPILEYSELSDKTEFLQSAIISISISINEKFGIETDFPTLGKKEAK